MGFVASFASKLSDTVSSEIGKVDLSIVTDELSGACGLDGCFSCWSCMPGVWEDNIPHNRSAAGTARYRRCSQLGRNASGPRCSRWLCSLVLCPRPGAIHQTMFAHCIMHELIRGNERCLLRWQVDAAGAAIVVLAAFLANLFESFLGATTQGQNDWLSNDVVNVIQISLAAGLGIAFMFCFACA